MMKDQSTGSEANTKSAKAGKDTDTSGNSLVTLPVNTADGIFVKGKAAFQSVELPGTLTVTEGINAEDFQAKFEDGFPFY